MNSDIPGPLAPAAYLSLVAQLLRDYIQRTGESLPGALKSFYSGELFFGVQIEGQGWFRLSSRGGVREINGLLCGQLCVTRIAAPAPGGVKLIDRSKPIAAGRSDRQWLN